MTLYTFSFDGCYLGGTIIVVTKSRKAALQIATEDVRERMGDRTAGTVCFVRKEKVKEKAVVYFDNGDY